MQRIHCNRLTVVCLSINLCKLQLISCGLHKSKDMVELDSLRGMSLKDICTVRENSNRHSNATKKYCKILFQKLEI